MEITVNNRSVELRLEEREPLSMLYELRDYLSYNNTLYKHELLLKGRGIQGETDWKDINQIRELAYLSDDTWYQNFLCYTVNLAENKTPSNYNFVIDQYFLTREMYDGYNDRKSVV